MKPDLIIVDFPHQRQCRVERTDISEGVDRNSTTTTMASDLIIDFPHQRKRRAVHFVDALQVHSYTPEYVAPPELWYTKSEYDLMKLAVRGDVLQVRAAKTPKKAVNVTASTMQSQRQGACLVGIEHLLTPACMKENRACRARCTQAVLAEQDRVRSASTIVSGWDRIALASVAETSNAVLRARKLGRLHRASI